MVLSTESAKFYRQISTLPKGPKGPRSIRVPEAPQARQNFILYRLPCGLRHGGFSSPARIRTPQPHRQKGAPRRLPAPKHFCRDTSSGAGGGFRHKSWAPSGIPGRRPLGLCLFLAVIGFLVQLLDLADQGIDGVGHGALVLKGLVAEALQLGEEFLLVDAAFPDGHGPSKLFG